mgnify:CR=1 FL=1
MKTNAIKLLLAAMIAANAGAALADNYGGCDPAMYRAGRPSNHMGATKRVPA